MIEDFFRGGSGYFPHGELERTKKVFCEYVFQVFNQDFHSDRSLFINVLKCETWILDDVLSRRYGTFTSDFLANLIQLLMTNDDRKKEFENIFHVDPNQIIFSLKLQAILKINKKIETSSQIDKVKINEIIKNDETAEALKKCLAGHFTLDSLLSLNEKIHVLDQIKLTTLPRISLADKFKKKILFKITTTIDLLSLKPNKIIMLTNFPQADVSRIISGKVDKISISRLLDFLEKINPNDDIDFW